MIRLFRWYYRPRPPIYHLAKSWFRRLRNMPIPVFVPKLEPWDE